MQTGLYAPGRIGVIDPRNRPFTPQYPLWSDGATKARWLYLPPGTTIDASSDADWAFPVGTRFWKEFTLDGRKVATRMLWRVSRERWIAATYAWNAEQTDAVLAPDEGRPGVVEIAPGRSYGIPSTADCHTCHGAAVRTRPLGFTALQLSGDRDPNALHGEPVPPDSLTLETLVREGLMTPQRWDLAANPPRIRTANAQTRAVFGYLSANCGACHGREGDVPTVAPFVGTLELLKDADAVARAIVRRSTAWEGSRDRATTLIDPAAPDQSAVLMRMRSRQPSSQMPPLGTVVPDQAALDAITRWIAQRPPPE